jgi:hypothetical protein
MKLPSTVMDAVRGIGGAALIAAVGVGGAGCGGATQASAVTAPGRVATVSTNQARTDEAKAEPAARVEVDPEPDWAAACGRG